MTAIQKRIENNVRDSINNSDSEIRMLVGTGDWRERSEVVDANIRLNELLIAFLDLGETFMQQEASI